MCIYLNNLQQKKFLRLPEILCGRWICLGCKIDYHRQRLIYHLSDVFTQRKKEGKAKRSIEQNPIHFDAKKRIFRS